MIELLLAPAAVIASAIVLIALERVFPFDEGQRVVRAGFWQDIGMYSIVQNYALGWVIAAGITMVDAHTGLSRLGLLRSWSVEAQLVFFLVTHDFYIYWFHRLQHASPFLWRIHEAHHSTTEVDWLSGARSHPLEILINQSIEFAPIVLLGAAPSVAVLKGVIDAVYGMFIHSNLRVRLGPLLAVFNGPELHRWHHAADASIGAANFGTKLTIWDRLFGTARSAPGLRPSSYGIADAEFPHEYFRQVMYAFRRSAPDSSTTLPRQHA